MTFTIQCHSASNKLRCADGFGVNVCMLNENVTIDGSDFSFAVRDHRIEVLFFSPNRNVQFLPVKVANFFPHLQHYRASFCFIKVVLKENFKRLSELTILDLSHNFIVAIHDDTFDDLQNVDVIDLSEYSTHASHQLMKIPFTQAITESLTSMARFSSFSTA